MATNAVDFEEEMSKLHPARPSISALTSPSRPDSYGTRDQIIPPASTGPTLVSIENDLKKLLASLANSNNDLSDLNRKLSGTTTKTGATSGSFEALGGSVQPPLIQRVAALLREATALADGISAGTKAVANTVGG